MQRAFVFVDRARVVLFVFSVAGRQDVCLAAAPFRRLWFVSLAAILKVFQSDAGKTLRLPLQRLHLMSRLSVLGVLCGSSFGLGWSSSSEVCGVGGGSGGRTV